jgi:hypothetical protein
VGIRYRSLKGVWKTFTVTLLDGAEEHRDRLLEERFGAY